MRFFPVAVTAVFLFSGLGAIEAEARAPDRSSARPASRSTAPQLGRPQAARGAATQARNGYGQVSFMRVSYGSPVAGRSTGTRQAMGRRGGGRSYGGGGGGISCVPYAREASGIAITGNGRDWWHNASGLYDRSHRPEPGSVMAMPGTGAMRMGHVAVVERVLGPREIEIHHANWGGPGIRRGSVMRGVNVIDVSSANDWSAVRVQSGHTDEAFGRVYPVYGFIHNRPDRTGGTMLAGSGRRPVEIVEGGRSVSLGDLRATEVAQGSIRR
ncbi:MAG: CHAP domain-containing protein [Pseudomonadota bacterium]